MVSGPCSSVTCCSLASTTAATPSPGDKCYLCSRTLVLPIIPAVHAQVRRGHRRSRERRRGSSATLKPLCRRRIPHDERCGLADYVRRPGLGYQGVGEAVDQKRVPGWHWGAVDRPRSRVSQHWSAAIEMTLVGGGATLRWTRRHGRHLVERDVMARGLHPNQRAQRRNSRNLMGATIASDREGGSEDLPIMHILREPRAVLQLRRVRKRARGIKERGEMNARGGRARSDAPQRRRHVRRSFASPADERRGRDAINGS
jgi:hypothetical protein